MLYSARLFADASVRLLALPDVGPAVDARGRDRVTCCFTGYRSGSHR